MNTKILFLYLLLITNNIFSQKTELISINFNNESYKSVLLKLSRNVNKPVFFETEWLKSKKKISSSYSNKSLNYILNSFFENNNLNYILIDDKNIITSNSLVKELPPYLFSETDSISNTTFLNINYRLF